ncbi:MAG: hypothetical protein E7223_05985 [Clostridiales bacterium]|nr:hypothetical protein [Clostridiales bacterium]
MHVSPDGRRYIGQTSRKPVMRWQQGSRYTQNKDFYDAIKFYGEENLITVFSHYVLHRDGQTWIAWDKTIPQNITNIFTSVEADSHEKKWISIYETNIPSKGFNRTSGGNSDFTYSDIVIKRNSAAKQGVYEGENNPFHGHRHSPSTIRTLSEYASQRTGVKNGMFWKKHSLETRKKISEANSKEIRAYSLSGSLIETFPSVRAAAANGRTPSSAGYVWKYKM